MQFLMPFHVLQPKETKTSIISKIHLIIWKAMLALEPSDTSSIDSSRVDGEIDLLFLSSRSLLLDRLLFLDSS